MKLGWSDSVSLDEGIDETIAWVDAHLSVLKNEPLDYVHKP
jgi:dTDP-glucose 4,6-dehydratase